MEKYAVMGTSGIIMFAASRYMTSIFDLCL